MQLKNKKALVTGASRGIGKAIALRLAAEGAAVVVHYHHDTAEAESVVAEIRRSGGQAQALQADLQDRQQVQRLGETAWAAFEGLDFLVNNAGISYKRHFLDQTEKDIDDFTDINFKGTLFLTQAVARKMVSSGTEGAIYTITSINGISPGVGHSVYGATKGALEILMKGVALELAPHNIKVNTIAVGAIRTDMNAAVWLDPEKLALANSNIPLQRLGEAEEIAAVICGLLVSGSYMTGASLTIDGGWLLKHGFENPKPYKK